MFKKVTNEATELEELVFAGKAIKEMKINYSRSVKTSKGFFWILNVTSGEVEINNVRYRGGWQEIAISHSETSDPVFIPWEERGRIVDRALYGSERGYNVCNAAFYGWDRVDGSGNRDGWSDSARKKWDRDLAALVAALNSRKKEFLPAWIASVSSVLERQAEAKLQTLDALIGRLGAAAAERRQVVENARAEGGAARLEELGAVLDLLRFVDGPRSQESGAKLIEQLVK